MADVQGVSGESVPRSAKARMRLTFSKRSEAKSDVRMISPVMISQTKIEQLRILITCICSI